MGISRLFKAEVQEQIATSIGDLCVFAISWKDLNALFKEMTSAEHSADALSFMRRFAQHVCYPAAALLERKYKPNNPVLDDAELKKLTGEDLEKVATSYLAHNQHLYRSRVEDASVDEYGKKVVRFKDGDVVHPKKEDESDSQYLARLIGILKTETEKRNAELLRNLRGSFSSGLFDEIQHTQTLGNDLLSSMRSNLAIAAAMPPKSTLDSTLLQELTERQEQGRGASLEELRESVDSLVSLTEAATEFSVQGNKTQTDISAVLKRSSDEAKMTGRLNVYLTIAVLAVTIIALLTTYSQIHEESAARATLESQTRGHVEQIVGAIGNVEAQLKLSQTSKSEMDELNTRVEYLTAALKRQSEQSEQKIKNRSKNHSKKYMGSEK